MVSDQLLNEQAQADIERTKALTREIESKIEITKIDLEIKKVDLERLRLRLKKEDTK